MKHSFISKIFLFLAAFTFFTYSMATLAFQKAATENPRALNQMAESVYINAPDNGVFLHFSGDSKDADFQKGDKNWEFAGNLQQVKIELRSADIILEASPDQKTHLVATGFYNIQKSSDMIEVEYANHKLILTDKHTEPRNAVVRLQIPAPLQSLDIAAVSGDITARDLVSDRALFQTISGDMRLQRVSFKKIGIDTVSAEVSLENKTPADIEINSISGDIAVTSPGLDKARHSITTVSGDVQKPFSGVRGADLKLEVSTISGDVKIR